MNRILLALFFCLQVATAWAGCNVGALPFQLQNNTTADATQVMADFNQITTGVGSNCAAAGANNDITSLGALSTPISPAQGGTPVFAGGVTGGTSTAQTLTVPANFTLTTGYHISGFFSIGNTAAMTMTVNGGAAVSVFRKQQFGVTSTQGGEAIAGHPFEMVYNGAQWVMLGETIMIAEMRTYSGGSAPAGWFIADGSTFVCATFQDLCNVIGTTYGGSASNPALPDTRARVMTGLDNYGTGVGAASRLTAAATGCGSAFTAIGAVCANASQSHTQIVAELAAHAHGTTESPHTHSLNGGTGVVGAQAGASSFGGATGLTVITTTGATSTGLTVNSNGSSQAMPIVPNNLGQLMIIRY